MADSKNLLIIDEVADTATLHLYVDAVLVTSYSYAGGNVTLSERPSETVVSVPQLVKSIQDIITWSGLIKARLAPPAEARPETKYQVVTKEKRIVLTCELAGVPAIDAIYRDNTQQITFQPRPELTSPYSCYRRFVYALDMLQQEIKGTTWS